MKSEHLATLEILESLFDGRHASAADLAALDGCSVATLKRRLADLRHLGAHVESVKLGSRWQYHLANESAVRSKASAWLELERAQSLI